MNILLNKISRCTVFTLAFLYLAPITAGAGYVDGSKPLLCATTTVIECLDNGECAEIALVDVNMPRFYSIDFDNKELRHTGPGASNKTSSIERQEHVDGKLILQGAEDGIKDVRDGLGWTLAISETSGEFVLSASGDQVAFVVFGACISIQ